MVDHVCLVWDFGGTLGERKGLISEAMYQTIEELHPTSPVSLDAVWDTPKSAFPWNRHDEPHAHITSPDQWWDWVLPGVAETYESLGFSQEQSAELGRAFRRVFTDPASYRLFDDTLGALHTLSAQGYVSTILSNHVPELEAIVTHLGIRRFFSEVFSSALIGYEKPNPGAYEHVRRTMGARYRYVMIGDSPIPDVVGAEAVGMEAILVRRHHRLAEHSVDNLAGLPAALDNVLSPAD